MTRQNKKYEEEKEKGGWSRITRSIIFYQLICYNTSIMGVSNEGQPLPFKGLKLLTFLKQHESYQLILFKSVISIPYTMDNLKQYRHIARIKRLNCLIK